MAKVSLIIPIHGRFQYVHDLIAKFQRQTRVPDEFIVVDNSKEDPGAVPSHIKYVRNNEVSSISGNYNVGGRHATGDLILLTQQDCYPESVNAVEELVREIGESHVAATSRITLPEEVFAKYNFWGKAMMAKWRGTAKQGISGKLDMIRASVFRKIGGYDTNNFFFAGEDTDLYLRLTLQGRVANTDVNVIHHHNQHVRTTWLDVIKRNYMYAEGFGANVRKHGLRITTVPYTKHWTHHLNKFAYPFLGLVPFFPITACLIIFIASNLAQIQAWQIKSWATPIMAVISPLIFLASFAGTVKGFLSARQTFCCNK